MKLYAPIVFAIIFLISCRTEPAKVEIDKTDLVVNNNLLKDYVNKVDPNFSYEVKDTFDGNRSYIVNRKFILEVQKYFKGNLILTMNDNARTNLKTGNKYVVNLKSILGL